MKNKLFIIGLPLALAVCISVYAKDGDKEGSLTITGIPAEYNGKFASFSYNMGERLNNPNKELLFASASDASKVLGKVEGAVITNGEVKLLLFKPIPIVGSLIAYTDSKTFRIELCIRDTEESPQKPSIPVKVEPDFIFPSVTFKNGVATVKLNDAFKVGILTITGFPPGDDGSANIKFNRPDEKKKGQIWFHDTYGKINNGTLTVKYYREEEINYMPYTGMVDIVLLGRLFKAQMTNDNATLNFADGVKK